MNEFIKTPKYLACYFDYYLKKKIKEMPDEERNNHEDLMIKLFCYLHSRDSFFKCFQEFLANRLLEKSFLIDDAEKSILQKL